MNGLMQWMAWHSDWMLCDEQEQSEVTLYHLAPKALAGPTPDTLEGVVAAWVRARTPLTEEESPRRHYYFQGVPGHFLLGSDVDISPELREVLDQRAAREASVSDDIQLQRLTMMGAWSRDNWLRLGEQTSGVMADGTLVVRGERVGVFTSAAAANLWLREHQHYGWKLNPRPEPLLEVELPPMFVKLGAQVGTSVTDVRGRRYSVKYDSMAGLYLWELPDGSTTKSPGDALPGALEDMGATMVHGLWPEDRAALDAIRQRLFVEVDAAQQALTTLRSATYEVKALRQILSVLELRCRRPEGAQ